MTEPDARRIVLALMAKDTFGCVLDATVARDNGYPVQEDYGFSFAEIQQAQQDRHRISSRYAELKRACSFTASEITAKTEWLMTIGKDRG